jgi:hypothetical protein
VENLEPAGQKVHHHRWWTHIYTYTHGNMYTSLHRPPNMVHSPASSRHSPLSFCLSRKQTLCLPMQSWKSKCLAISPCSLLLQFSGACFLSDSRGTRQKQNHPLCMTPSTLWNVKWLLSLPPCGSCLPYLVQH